MPSEIMTTISAHFEAPSNPEEHEKQMNEALTTTIRRNEAIDEYVNRHMKFRQK